MKWQLGCAALALFGWTACRSADDPSSVPAGQPDADVASVAIPPAGDGGAKVGSAAAGAILGMAYTASGTLIVQTERGLTSIAADTTSANARTDLALPPHAVVTLSGTLGSSLAVQIDDDVLLVNLSPLAIALRAHGRPIGTPEIGMVETTTDGSHDVAVRLIAPGSRDVVRLKLEDGLDGHVEEMAVSPSQHFAIVTVNAEQGGQSSLHSFSYGLATGQRIAEVLNFGQSTFSPNATFAGDHEIGFRGSDLVEVDLASGATVKKVAYPCKPAEDVAEAARGNPILDPSGSRLITTCQFDGILIDAHTFHRVRTYKTLVPGCDNGFALPAHFRADGKQLIVEGCGGEAHLDLATGKYACGDDPGLMGRPYWTPPSAVGHEPVKPPQPSGPRVPTCHAEGAEDATELSPHWQVSWMGSDTRATVFAVGTDPKQTPSALQFGILTGSPVVSPNEDRLAVLTGNAVIIHELPSGKVRKQFDF